MERDLIGLGLRLRSVGLTPDFDFQDLWVICDAGSGDPNSFLARALAPEDAVWGSLDSLLLAEVADRLALIIWQNGGGKGKKPSPIERPGRRAEKQALLRDGSEAHGFGGLDLATIKDPRVWLREAEPVWRAAFEAAENQN